MSNADKKSIVIGVDIDDTIALSAPMVIKYSNDRWGTSLKVSDYTEDWAGMWGVDFDEVKRRADEYFSSGILMDYKMMPGAHGVLNNLSSRFKIISVTARNDICKTDTFSWISKNYGEIFNESDLHFTGAWDKLTEHSVHHTKDKICKQLGVDILIDDQLKHCISAAEAGIASILFGDYSWNAADDLPENVVRAKDWLEVSRYINENY